MSGRDQGVCAWCEIPIPARARRDAVCCSARCRQARHRFLRAAGSAGQVTGRPLLLPAAGLAVVPLPEANRLLAAWGHDLGPVNRPFGSQAWVLCVGAEPVSAAVSVSTVSDVTAGYPRTQLVELGRLCSKEPWANRVMLRLWREVAAPRWPYWTPLAAVSYSLNSRHDGQLYRFDGWTKITAGAGSHGGGAWSRPQYAAPAAHGPKTLWLWRYPFHRRPNVTAPVPWVSREAA